MSWISLESVRALYLPMKGQCSTLGSVCVLLRTRVQIGRTSSVAVQGQDGHWNGLFGGARYLCPPDLWVLNRVHRFTQFSVRTAEAAFTSNQGSRLLFLDIFSAGISSGPDPRR
jgi:hypothetical protein